MHAELTIGHRDLPADDVLRRLTSFFGPHDPKVLDESPLYRDQTEAWQTQPMHASQAPGYRVICIPSWNEELQIFVEVDRGDVRRSAESAWRAVRSALQTHQPRVVSAEILDFGSGQSVLTAQTGLRTELRRREAALTLLGGLVSIGIVVVGFFGFAREARMELIAGAAPGVASAMVTFVIAARHASERRLRWPE